MGTPPQPETEDAAPAADEISADDLSDLLATDALAPEGGSAPSVVAVVVSTNPSERFEECLTSLIDQDYDELSLLVIDAGSEQPIADRVASIAPDAFVHRLTNNPGRAAAADQALQLVSGAKFLLFCHDDISLESHALSVMVEEVFRSNAGIVGPKIVDWDDRRRLHQVGMGSDQFGAQVDLIEPGDFDQEQYDVVRDVFVIPSAVQLVRADLFRALNGFDPVQSDFGDDLDFCWRAHVAGARVLVVPSAIARHAAEELKDATINDRRRALSRGRLRTLAITSSKMSLVRTLPFALLLLLIEGVYSLLAGRRRQSADAFGAIMWNATRLGDIRERRAKLAAVRQVPDREIRALQVGGSARLSSFVRTQLGGSQGRLLGFFGSVRSSLDDDDAGIVRDGLLLLMATAGLLLFGSRHLLTRPIGAVGMFPEVGPVGDLVSEWWGGWRSAGLGGTGNAPTALIVLAALKTLLLGSDRLLQLVLVVGPLIGGLFGMWRLVRPFGSYRAAGVSTLLYLCTPLVPTMMGNGRWDALVVWASAPFLLGSLLRVQGLEPFGSHDDTAGAGVVPRTVSVRLVRWGLLVALISTFVPAIVILAVGLCVIGVLTSVLLARPAGGPRLAVAGIVSLVAPAALHIPWSYDILAKGSWSWLAGPRSPYASFDSMADLVRFAPGPAEPSTLAIGLLVAAGVALVVGRAHRFDAGAFGWIVATASFLAIWVERRGWLAFSLPAPELMLAIAAAGLAMAVGVAVRSVESDLAAFRFGWRQGVAIAGSVGVVASVLLGLGSALNGRWEMPVNGYASSIAPLNNDVDGTVRALFIGDPGVMPIDTATSPSGISYAVSDNLSLDVTRRWVPAGYGESAHIGELLDLAASGDTARLGRLLSAYGIDLVIIVPQLAPPPFVAPAVSGGAAIENALMSQLDLRRVSGTPPLLVFRNVSSNGPAVALDVAEAPIGGSVLDIVAVDLASAPRVPLTVTAGGRWEGTVPADRLVVVATDADGWAIEGARTELAEGLGGNIVIQHGGEGTITMSRKGDWVRRALLGGQAGLVFVGLQIARQRRKDIK